MSARIISPDDILTAVQDVVSSNAQNVPMAALASIRSLLGADAAAWLDRSGDQLTSVAVTGVLQPETHRHMVLSASEGLAGQVLARDEPVSMRDYASTMAGVHGPPDLLHREGVVSAAAVPVRSGTAVTGVVVLLSRRERHFREDELRHVVGLAGIAQQLREARKTLEHVAARAVPAERLNDAVDLVSLELLRGRSADEALAAVSGVVGARLTLHGVHRRAPSRDTTTDDEVQEPRIPHQSVSIPGAENTTLDADGAAPSRTMRSLAQIVGLDLARRRASMETEIRLTDQFVHSLLTANTEELARLWNRSSLLGMDLEVARAVVCIGGEDPVSRPVLNTIVREMRSRTFSGQATVFDGAVIVLWPVPDSAAERRLPEQIRGLLTACGSPRLTAGLGPVCRRADDYPTSVKEAVFARQVAHFSGDGQIFVSSQDLGMFRLFAHIGGVETLRSSVRDTLGPLLDADDTTGSDLVHTLKVFLERDRRIAETARALHVHVNTLRYRVERIGKLLRIDLDNSESRFFLTLALRLFPIVEADAARVHLLDRE